MLNAQLAELEQEFRKQWNGYQPHAYAAFLEQVSPEDEAALLARLLPLSSNTLINHLTCSGTWS